METEGEVKEIGVVGEEASGGGERERDRQIDRQTDRHRQKKTDTERGAETEKERERKREHRARNLKHKNETWSNEQQKLQVVTIPQPHAFYVGVREKALRC